MEFVVTKANVSPLLTFGINTGTVTKIYMRQFFCMFLKSCQPIMSVFSKYLKWGRRCFKTLYKTLALIYDF